MWGVRVQDMEKTITALGVTTAQLRAGFDAAVFISASRVITQAMAAAPVQSGRLRKSRFVTRTVPVQAGFGAPYSAVVHEVGRHRKFLSRTLAAAAPRFAADVANILRAAKPGALTLATAPGTHPTTPEFSAASSRRRPVGPARRARR